jgi:hypothetical protein
VLQELWRHRARDLERDRGLPIAGGYGAWRSTSRLAEEIISRRPPVQR